MTLISNTYKYIFIHIPKTGGTTFTSGLAKFNTPLDIEIGGTKFGEKLALLYIEKYGLGKHSTALKIKRLVGEKTYADFFSFAFVRNPYERTLSTYSFLKSWRNWPQSAVMDQFSNIRDFIKSDFFSKKGPDNILEPQYLWVTNEQGDLMVNQVFKLEESSSIYPKLMDRLGLEYEEGPMFKTLNTSKKSTADIEVIQNDAEIKEIILKKYKRDFQLFDY
ncbi:MAG: sulfotransferase family 2 domain-containing protein [Lewinella sp.]|nr:sulfotransferase family 2 domain-containing protein [Lewinella sp.]